MHDDTTLQEHYMQAHRSNYSHKFWPTGFKCVFFQDFICLHWESLMHALKTVGRHPVTLVQCLLNNQISWVTVISLIFFHYSVKRNIFKPLNGRKSKKSWMTSKHALAWNNPDNRTVCCNATSPKPLFSFEWDLMFQKHQFREAWFPHQLSTQNFPQLLIGAFAGIFSKRDKQITHSFEMNGEHWCCGQF